MTLSLFQIQQVLGNVEYRPGWTIEAYETEAQGIWVAITAEVEDSFHPGEWVKLRVKSPLPPLGTEGDILRWLRWRLERIEVHECHEWLRWKVGGEPIWNPHDERADEPR